MPSLKGYSENLNRPSPPHSWTEEVDKNQVVYFIQIQPPVGPIKIGITANIKKRLFQLQTACPYDLKVLSTIPGWKDTELIIHEKFKNYRIRGEWFHPHQDILERISNGT